LDDLNNRRSNTKYHSNQERKTKCHLNQDLHIASAKNTGNTNVAVLHYRSFKKTNSLFNKYLLNLSSNFRRRHPAVVLCALAGSLDPVAGK